MNSTTFIPINQNDVSIYYIHKIPTQVRRKIELLSRVTNLECISIIYATSHKPEHNKPEHIKFRDPYLSMIYSEIEKDLKKYGLKIQVTVDNSAGSTVRSNLVQICSPFKFTSDIYDEIFSCAFDKFHSTSLTNIKELVCIINLISAELSAKSAKIVKWQARQFGQADNLGPVAFDFQRRHYNRNYNFLTKELKELGLYVVFDCPFNSPTVQEIYFSDPYIEHQRWQAEQMQAAQLWQFEQPNFNIRDPRLAPQSNQLISQSLLTGSPFMTLKTLLLLCLLTHMTRPQ